MSHCFQRTQNKAWFELRNTEHDRSRKDQIGKRRSELSGSLYGDPTRLPNGVRLWGAMQFVHHPWADPAGMAQLHGGVHGQVHIGNAFGGSPALAFRRTKMGDFEITTRGRHDQHGTVRFHCALPFGTVHDLVYALTLHESVGALAVWLDGAQIVDVERQSIGTHHAQSYWNVGCYYAGGITCPVIAEYAHHVYPGTASLSCRIGRPPLWP